MTAAPETMRVFLDSRRYGTDCCAKEARDQGNEEIFGYSTYQYLPVACKDPNIRSPEFMYDHVNLRGRPGYGLADSCLVDRYSGMRNDPSQLTRDRCRQQLFSRIFQGCPNLKPGVPNPDAEMPIQQGTNSANLEGVTIPCKKAIMELTTNKFMPMLDCVKEVQKPEHIVEDWTRGGTDTRNYMLRQQMLAECGYNNQGRAATGPAPLP